MQGVSSNLSQDDKVLKGTVYDSFFDCTFSDEKVVGDFVDELTVVKCVEAIHKVRMFKFPLILLYLKLTLEHYSR